MRCRLLNLSVTDGSKLLDCVSTEAEDHSDDATWVLTSSFIILTMQSGFGLLESGTAGKGNEVNVMMKNVVDVCLGGMTYWVFGYGLSFGQPDLGGFMGGGDFFVEDHSYGHDEHGLRFSEYVFQFSFAATATTIVSGAVTGRFRFSAYMAFSALIIPFYAIPCHWVFHDAGWLKRRGFFDFAGDGTVHIFGACNALVAALLVGPRIGRWDPGQETRHGMTSPTSVLFGMFMLWWGWIGFNCGSTFGITGDKWIVASTRHGLLPACCNIRLVCPYLRAVPHTERLSLSHTALDRPCCSLSLPLSLVVSAARVGMATVNASASAGLFAIFWSAYLWNGRYKVDTQPSKCTPGPA